jgi:protein-S-isoprenylcysteine O-methyltransferase Ste14
MAGPPLPLIYFVIQRKAKATNQMQTRSEPSRTNLAPAVVAVVVALVAIAALLIAENDLRYETRSGGVSMITTAVVERAGAVVSPTVPAVRP